MSAGGKALGRRERLFSDAKGELRVWCPGQRVLATEFMGVLTVGLAQDLATFSDECFAREGKLSGFHDWECMLGYDADARAALTRWALSVAQRIDELHFLTRSKLVQMGLQVGNLTLKVRMHPYTVRAPFEAAFQKATGTKPARVLADGARAK